MPEILKVFQLAKHDGVAKVQIGRGWIHAELHSQRLAGGSRLLDLLAQLRLFYDFGGAFLEVSQLLVGWCEGWHAI